MVSQGRRVEEAGVVEGAHQGGETSLWPSIVLTPPGDGPLRGLWGRLSMSGHS